VEGHRIKLFDRLDLLRHHGADVFLDGSDVLVEAPPDSIADELWTEVQSQKDAIRKTSSRCRVLQSCARFTL
jgi:hypothetical protein